MKIVLATHNEGKVRELRQLLSGLGFDVVSLTNYPELPEVIEDGDTFEANAIKKAVETAAAVGEISLADDSGLEVDYLDGAPGVHSARFAGPERGDSANNQKLLQLLEGIPRGKRTAKFRCVVAVATPGGKVATVDGSCEGIIETQPSGSGGFGYDPLFWVPEFGKTFAELNAEIKNAISHRGRALKKVGSILKDIVGE